jgi:hypothetical protein
VVFCSLPGHFQLEQVLTGEGGVIAALAGRPGPPPVIVDLGTSSVESTRQMAALASRSGIRYCDAPVARTRQAAIDGTLAVMVGGDQDVVEHIRPLLGCMATDVTYCGPAGSGQIVKQLNNMVLFQNVLAIAEAHAIATAAGLEGALLFDPRGWMGQPVFSGATQDYRSGQWDGPRRSTVNGLMHDYPLTRSTIFRRAERLWSAKRLVTPIAGKDCSARSSRRQRRGSCSQPRARPTRDPPWPRQPAD